jgi:cAMP phosphodiesterase
MLTEEQSDEVLSEQTCDLIWDRCHREIVRGETKHLIVLLSIPIAYPRVVCFDACCSAPAYPADSLGRRWSRIF